MVVGTAAVVGRAHILEAEQASGSERLVVGTASAHVLAPDWPITAVPAVAPSASKAGRSTTSTTFTYRLPCSIQQGAL